MKDAFTALALTLFFGPTFADPWKDESGMGRWGLGYYRRYSYDYKLEISRGPCKVERKWERSGEYKCKGYR
jgi:hypothetical protein